MFVTFKKWTLIYIMTILGLLGCFAAILWHGGAINASKMNKTEGDTVLLIDPGHGGADGGAVDENGSREADINLAVALKTELTANFVGIETAMTRREDISIHSPEAETIREIKESDLKNRVTIANRIPGGVLLSIHQNTLPGFPSVHGGQVFYNCNGEAEEWAEAVQRCLNDTVNDRPKTRRRAGSDIYVMDRARCPGILVECGFLSNPFEAEQLQTQEYQKKLSVILTAPTAEKMFSRGQMEKESENGTGKG